MKLCACPNCETFNNVPEAYLGSHVKCTGCNAEFRAVETVVAPQPESEWPKGAWPVIREGLIVASHVVIDWGNKVRLETKRKRVGARARRLEGDRGRGEKSEMRVVERTTADNLFVAEDEEEFGSKEWRGWRPTRKQIACLRHLGVMDTPDCRGQASDWIDQRFKASRYDSELKRIVDDWEIVRLIKHSDIFGEELHSFYEYKLYDELHQGVRRSVVGASGKLTRAKIAAVVNGLTNENPWWIKDPSRFFIFFERLKIVHPECCDGRTPDRNSSKSTNGQPAGCAGVIVIGTVIIGGIAGAILF